MRKIHIAAEQFTTEEEVHDFFQEQFNLPDYYGRNLDALYDVLSEVTEKTQIIISSGVADEANLGEYGERLLTVLEEVAQDNNDIKLKIVE
jgi:ribonuclease inhibitor